MLMEVGKGDKLGRIQNTIKNITYLVTSLRASIRRSTSRKGCAVQHSTLKPPEPPNHTLLYDVEWFLARVSCLKTYLEVIRLNLLVELYKMFILQKN